MKINTLIEQLQKIQKEYSECDIYIHHEQAVNTGKINLVKVYHDPTHTPYTKGDNMLAHNAWDTKFPVVVLFGTK